MHELTIYTDGGARSNPGPAGIGIHMYAEGFEEKIGETIGTATNNVAEYTAVLRAIETIIPLQGIHHFTKLSFFLDSELVQRQLIGQYKVKDPNMQEFHRTITSKLKELGIPFSFTHVRREQNKVADALYNAALDAIQ